MPDDQAQRITIRQQEHPRRLRLLIGLLIAGLAMTGGSYAVWDWWTHGRFIESTNDAYLQADAVIIAPKISGYVSAVPVTDNETVRSGQVLLRIDSASYRAALDIAAAEIVQRKADLTRFEADAAKQDAIRTEALARLSIAESAARFAVGDAERFQRLAQTGADTAQRRDQAVSTRDQALGQTQAARAAVATAARELDALKAQIGQGQAALGAAEARERQVRTDLDGVEITTPIAGIIGDRTVRIGQFVQPGTRLMSVVPVQDIYLVANFKETQLASMRPGQPAEIVIDALGGGGIKGIIDSFAPGTGSQFALLPPENATGNFTKIVQRVPVRIRLMLTDSERQALRPGLSAEVDIDTKPAGPGL